MSHRLLQWPVDLGRPTARPGPRRQAPELLATRACHLRRRRSAARWAADAVAGEDLRGGARELQPAYLPIHAVLLSRPRSRPCPDPSSPVARVGGAAAG